MKVYLYSTLFFLFTIALNAQVGIGTTTPDASSMLEIASANSGLLIPRVALLSTSDVTTIASPLTSLLVYNTGFAPNGFYYWNGAIWTALSGGAASGWLTTGNSGIIGTTNYMGTDASTNADVAFRRNNVAAGKLSATSTSFGVGALTAGAASNSAAFGNNALTLNTGADNVAVGTNTLSANVGGTSNTAVGKSALAANTTTGNTAIGYNALTANTTATGNTAIGFTALSTTTINGDNTAVGYQALKSDTGAQNTAMGVNALQQQTTGAANTAVGHSALNAAGAFSNSTAFGYQALWKNTASNITGIGFQALAANTIGVENTAVGFQAGAANTTGNRNTSLGWTALAGNNGSWNVALGDSALGRNAAGSNNVAIGYESMFGSAVSFNNSTAIGYHALFNNQSSDNTAVGYNALQGIGNAAGNTAVGSATLNNNSTGINNTAVGTQAGFAVTTSNNTYVGYWAGQFSSGSNNTGLGYKTFIANGASSSSVAIGYQALSLSTAANNTAVGYNSLSASNTATNNTAVGYNSLVAVTTGGSNVAVGYNALASNSVGTGNVAIGNQAGASEVGSNKLYISNSGTTPTTSLIYGDFSGTRILRTNSTFQIGDPAGTGYVFPIARGTINQVLQTDATGTLTWVAPSTLTITETDPQVSSVATSAVPKWNGVTLVDGVMVDDGTNVGVGITPSAGNKLEVSGNTKTTNFQMTTGANANYILQSDASGNASWVNPTVLPYTTTGAASGVYSILLSQYTIRVFNGVSEVRLPDAVANPGKVYIIIGSNGISSKIISTSGGLIYDDVSNTFISTINANQRYTVQSDGSNWIVTGI